MKRDKQSTKILAYSYIFKKLGVIEDSTYDQIQGKYSNDKK
ncbi:hypothetical protein [Bacillus sp. B1-b2]|nr:hypothetical protein [Bacillus sp. B1-b2]